ncbi:MAG: hypothetical protein LJE64_04410 [Desulfofustis sp.]|nr:hypothetical protein [Desulfofustis sp.]
MDSFHLVFLAAGEQGYRICVGLESADMEPASPERVGMDAQILKRVEMPGSDDVVKKIIHGQKKRD